MPIRCPGGQTPRYRWKGNVRLAWCGNKVVEVKRKGGKIHRIMTKKKKKKYK